MVSAIPQQQAKAAPQQAASSFGLEYENPYLDNEEKIMAALGEDVSEAEEKKELMDLGIAHSAGGSVFEKKLYDSFIKEKKSLLNYIIDLIKYAAKS